MIVLMLKAMNNDRGLPQKALPNVYIIGCSMPYGCEPIAWCNKIERPKES
jgi:hypothetical protein